MRYIFVLIFLSLNTLIGLEHEIIIHDLGRSWLYTSQARVTPYFSDEAIQERLIEHIDQEYEAIFIASFRFTSRPICDAVKRARLRGVKVEIVCDRGCLGIVHSKILEMLNEGIPIYTFPPISKLFFDDDAQKASTAALMHNKYIIFKGLRSVWTGSYNFTQAASSIHQENAVYIESHIIALEYMRQFELLKQRSSRVGMKPKQE